MNSLIDLFYRRRAGALAIVLLPALLVSLEATRLAAQTPQQPSQASKQQEARAAAPESRTPADASETDADAPPPGDWAPELLDAIISSQNPAAAEALYDAAFAAGPALIPQLEAALKDDRTAEFAAQTLAFVGGEKAEQILQTLITDRRNLDLRRFYLGSLGEYPAPEIEQLLLNAVAKSDVEPDRTVTEAAIWALTVRSEPDLPAKIKSAESGIEDEVIRDEADNARQVIASRLRYTASPGGSSAGASLDQAVRTYFIGALPQEPAAVTKPAAIAQRPATEPPAPTVELNRIIFAPDKARVLAHVTFEDADDSASYDMVLQKQLGDWKVVSVWSGADIDKPEGASPVATKPAPPVPARRSTTTKPAKPAGNSPSH